MNLDNNLRTGSVDMNYFGDRNSSKYKDANGNSSSFSFVIKNSMKKITKCYEKNSPVLENFVLNIAIYQKYYVKTLKKFLNNKDQVSKNDMKIFRIATELIIRIQEYSMCDM